MKRGRSIGAKDKNPRTKMVQEVNTPEEKTEQ